MKPRRGKGGRKRELFDEIERTLQETLRGPVPDALPASPVAEPTAGIPVDRGIDAALRRLTEIAEGNLDLAIRVAAIRKAVADYEARRADDEDEEILMLVL